ncbi:MAG: hypothetical protein ACK4LR_08060 [Acidovorax temperans]|uniref:hypothetical protein n=1 Tax=Acidovorax temperans TaxID=80878 RepID=UPI00391C21D9
MNRLAVFLLYALMLVGLLMLTGCASAPTASTATAVPVGAVFFKNSQRDCVCKACS